MLFRKIVLKQRNKSFYFSEKKKIANFTILQKLLLSIIKVKVKERNHKRKKVDDKLYQI